MTIYSACIGKCKEVSEANKLLKKLNEKGYKGYLYSLNDFYTLKVVMTPDMNKANIAAENLKRMGFDAFVI